jgi:hypothetical protein
LRSNWPPVTVLLATCKRSVATRGPLRSPRPQPPVIEGREHTMKRRRLTAAEYAAPTAFVSAIYRRRPRDRAGLSTPAAQARAAGSGSSEHNARSGHDAARASQANSICAPPRFAGRDRRRPHLPAYAGTRAPNRPGRQLSAGSSRSTLLPTHHRPPGSSPSTLPAARHRPAGSSRSTLPADLLAARHRSAGDSLPVSETDARALRST